MQRLVQQDACVITGKGPARSVRAMHAGREADNQEGRGRVAERRNRPTVIVGIFFFDGIKKRGQARTVSAVRIKYSSHPSSVAPGITCTNSSSTSFLV
jgi:hypothetical protein